MDTEQLKQIKDSIEELSPGHHLEVLKILKKNNSIVLNENKNGIFVNLTDISLDILLELEKYIKYISLQQTQLNLVENTKKEYEKTFFKDNKEIAPIQVENEG